MKHDANQLPARSGQGWYRLYAALFFAICLLPVAAMPFVPKQAPADDAIPAPHITTEDGSINLQYTAELEPYLTQHIAGRQQLVSLRALLQEQLLHTSASKDVILGKDGWLFYAQTADDYTGTDICTDAEIQKICRVLELMAEGAKSLGADFVFTVAPNKSTLYPEYMPARYRHARTKPNLTRLHETLLQTDVTYCDLQQTLETVKTDNGPLLYHKRDTHWNNTGALYSCNALLQTLGIPLPASYETLSYTVRQDWAGDLDALLYPVNAPIDRQMYYDLMHQYTHVGRVRTLNDPLLRTRCATGTKRLLMFRDSFGIALLPFLSDCFAEAQYERSVPYPLQQLEQTPADYVILELAERNLPDLLDKAPFLAAPRCNAPTQTDAQTLTVTPCVRVEQNLLQLCGIYQGAPDYTTDTRLVVSVRSPAGETLAFEAFPCLESELTGGGKDGFSLRLPGDPEPYRNSQMTLTVVTRDVAASSPMYTINW